MTRPLFLLVLIGSTALACGYAMDPQVPGSAAAPSEGEVLYNNQCANCHGRKGNMGVGGAKDLSTSALARDSVMLVVMRGRGTMMPYGELFTRKQIQAVVDHALSLRTPAGAEGPVK